MAADFGAAEASATLSPYEHSHSVSPHEETHLTDSKKSWALWRRATTPSTSARAHVGASLVAIALGAATGCVNKRWVDRFTSFHVSGIDASRIDALDDAAPAHRSSKNWLVQSDAKPLRLSDCIYWRGVKSRSDHESEVVRHYVEARTSSVCTDFPDVFEDTTPADLETLIAKRTAHYQAEGPLEEGSLDPFEKRSYALARGKCYVLVLRLKPGYGALEEAKKYVRFVAIADGVGLLDAPPVGTEIQSDPLHGHGSALDLGCPTGNGAVRIESQPTAIARGRYSAQLVSKPVSEAELEAQRAAYEQDVIEEDARSKQRIRNVCAECQDDYRECIQHPGPGSFDCRASLAECVQLNASAKITDCP